MDESTRIIIAYASLFLGFPMIAAKIIWFVPGAVAALVLNRIIGRLDLFASAIAEGFISFLLTRQIFEHLMLPVVWEVPLILILITSLWYYPKPEGFKALPSVFGIIVAILLYPGGLMYPAIPLIARM
ncbi:MAG: hypothetical protein IH628_02160 [Proteobacteria bacterium]|nr:hypothetical protein [Pseudomonadota bacterium]